MMDDPNCGQTGVGEEGGRIHWLLPEPRREEEGVQGAKHRARALGGPMS